jgi:hypothetical protein
MREGGAETQKDKVDMENARSEMGDMRSEMGDTKSDMSSNNFGNMVGDK